MKCITCGSSFRSHASQASLCPSCIMKSSQCEQPPTENKIDEIDPPEDLSNWLICAGLISFGFVVVLFAYLYGTSSEKLTYDSSGSLFTISKDEGKSRLNFSYQERAHLSGRINHYISESGSFKKGGVIAKLLYLDHNSYALHEKTFGNSRQCKASFYNQHMKVAFLLSSSPICREVLSNASFNKWDSFSLSGVYATFKDGNNGEKKLMLPTGNLRYFVVDDCTRLLSQK